MDEAELAAQLSLLLAEELADRIPDLSRVVLALERAPGDAALAGELRRLLHVIKGASRSAGELGIESGTHELETLLAPVEAGAVIPPAILERSMALVDELEETRKRLAGGPTVSPTSAIDEERPDTSVRVGADDLDLMMAQSAAVLVARQRLADPVRLLAEVQADLALRRSLSAGQLATTSRKLADAHRELASALAGLGMAATQLDAHVRRARLRSIEEACIGYERIVHDAAIGVGKQADLEVHGGEVRVDRAQVDVLRDVLIQLVRNSIAHGIETPEVRQRAGKPVRGLVTIAASIVGDAVRIVVSDDGGGLDLEAIGQRAAQRGMHVDAAGDAARAIFAPGLSTASSITGLAGRGIGLDIAKQRIEALHGSIAVTSSAGRQTMFTIEIPTTVATITALVVASKDTAYAIPSSTVERVLRVKRDAIRYADGRSLLRVGETWLPLGVLAGVLGGDSTLPERGVAVLLVQANQRVAVLVDSIVAISDVAIGPLDQRLGRVRHLTGHARLANGSIALVINANDVIEDVLGMAVQPPAPVRAAATRRRILVVDDSATTRALETNILRSAGYEVVVAVDGEAALRQLTENANVDLVVSDVDMPNLDGFGLTQALRAIDRFATLPVILITARSTDEDRAKGLRVGASAYLVKSSFDQTVLLQTIARLL
ncbi:MAG: response regulator [Kofleriaceae bacterium]